MQINSQKNLNRSYCREQGRMRVQLSKFCVQEPMNKLRKLKRNTMKVIFETLISENNICTTLNSEGSA